MKISEDIPTTPTRQKGKGKFITTAILEFPVQCEIYELKDRYEIRPLKNKYYNFSFKSPSQDIKYTMSLTTKKLKPNSRTKLDVNPNRF